MDKKKAGIVASIGFSGLIGGGEFATPQEPPAKVRGVESFEKNEKPKAEDPPLSEADKIKLEQEERDLWQKTYKGPRLTDQFSAVINEHYMQRLDTWLVNTNGDKEAAFKKLAPQIEQFVAHSPKGNVMAVGVIVPSASNDMGIKLGGYSIPFPNTEVKNPPYTRADVAFGMPFGKIRIEADGKHASVTFPDAAGDIAVRPTNTDKLFEILTKAQMGMEQPESRVVLPTYPEEDGKDSKVKALKLRQENLDAISLTTAPGVQVDLLKAQGTKQHPLVIDGMGNADYLIGPETKHVRVIIEKTPPKGVQKQGVVVIPAELASKLKVSQTHAKSTDSEGIATHTSQVKLYNEESGVEIIVNGVQMTSDKVKLGDIATVSGALSVREGKESREIPLMSDSWLPKENFTQKDGGTIDSQPLHRRIYDNCKELKQLEHGGR